MSYEEMLSSRFPLQRQEIAEWAGKCAALFPKYVERWAAHPDVAARKPLLAEQAFDVPYRLPSGRVVRLRGKWDSVDLVGEGKSVGMWLQENKTKSGIDQVKIVRQLSYDLQTMFYLIALYADSPRWLPKAATKDKVMAECHAGRLDLKVAGVRYNFVRRAAHKTVASMLEKLGVDSRNGRVDEWFARWNVEVSADDVRRFRRECLDPVLENLCDDWEWWELCKKKKIDPFHIDARRNHFLHHWPRHFRMPYVGYNPLAEGGFGDVDEYLATGGTAGLYRADDLFPELKEQPCRE
jgi:hypothetical protein